MDCPHGFPKASNCILCMEDGPVYEPSKPARTEAFVLARYTGRCARRYQHRIEPGDSIAYVTDVGWCCRECAI